MFVSGSFTVVRGRCANGIGKNKRDGCHCCALKRQNVRFKKKEVMYFNCEFMCC